MTMATYEAKEVDSVIMSGVSHHDYTFESGYSMEVWAPDKEEFSLTLAPGDEKITFTPPRPLECSNTGYINN